MRAVVPLVLCSLLFPSPGAAQDAPHLAVQIDPVDRLASAMAKALAKP